MAFAFINGALLRPFPGVQDQDRLAEIGILENMRLGTLVRLQAARTALGDYPGVVRALREGMPSLDGLASFFTESDVAATLPQPRSLQAAVVSANYFDVLGVQPEIGRTFAPEEGRGDSASVGVIGRALWMREFGGDPSVIGRPIQVGGQILAVIGVAPQGFAGMRQNLLGTGGVELWLPIALADLVTRDDLSIGRRPGLHAIRYVGRVRDGVRVDRVETELGVVARRLGVARPADAPAAGGLSRPQPTRLCRSWSRCPACRDSTGLVLGRWSPLSRMPGRRGCTA